VEVIIAADEFDKQIEEVEEVECAGLARLGKCQDGEERLEGRVSGEDGFELL
jgi:hypothetical protein